VEEETMPHPGAYRGNKRQKELKRLQKREEKHQKKVLKKTGSPGEPEILEEPMTGEPIPADGSNPGNGEAQAPPEPEAT
jgi:hypothetical protein